MDSDSNSVEDSNLQAKKLTREDSLSADDQEAMKERTYDLLKRGEIEIELHEQIKREILILGDTGNGKTKFTQWVAGDNTKLFSVETEEGTDEYIIEEDDNDMFRSIITSETIFPQLVVDVEANEAIYDCPGFNDTRDASNEIASTYFIKKVVDHAESVKLIFVINHPSVRKGVDRHNFMKLVEHVVDFVKDIAKFKNSIALVVTKVDNQRVKQGNLVDNNKIITAVANFLIEIKQDLEGSLQDGSSRKRQLHEAAVKLISILLIRDEDNYARIGIFRRPDEPGPLNKISLLQEEKKHIKRLIHDKLVFSAKSNDDFGYTISANCKNKIHDLVEDINKTIKSCLCRINEEIKEHYSRIVDVILNTVKSFVDRTSSNGDLLEVTELSTHLRDGCHSTSGLIGNVTNPEDLADKINIYVCNLNINVLQDDLKEIENKGKYFNCLQVVSDKPLNIVQWDELFKEVEKYLSNAKKNIQAEIDVVVPVICEQIESDFQQIARAFQDQFDENIKSLDTNEALNKLTNFHDVMSKMAVNTTKAMSVTELLKIVVDVTRDLIIDLPEHNKLNALQKEQIFICLKHISETEVSFVPSAWTQPFENVVKYLHESIIWYKFLEGLFTIFSEYEIQKNRDKYNVLEVEDWGITGKPQGIVVTKSNFPQFLSNIGSFNIVLHDDVKNITLTELRLDGLNQLLKLTLKHQLDIQHTQKSIIISSEYVSIKEIVAHLGCNLGLPLLHALKSGVCKFVHIFAFRKVFIDEDMSLPGVELSIISPKWEVIGTKKINLDGFDGEPHIHTQAAKGVGDGGDGKNGKPGLPGKPGGNFFAIGKTFVNGANLTVTVRGGRGGPGQNGGNGREGRRGHCMERLRNIDMPEGPGEITTMKGFRCEKIRSWSSPSLFLSVIKVFGFPHEENTIYRIHGFPGQIGGDGGHGGKGGKGGNHGNVVIHRLNGDSEIAEDVENGEDGINGMGGKGEKGGLNGKNILGMLNGLFSPVWIDQFDEPTGAASDGVNGSPGLNGVRLDVPKLSHAVSEPYKIINEYEENAKQSLMSPFEKALQLSFITQLKEIIGIKDN